MPRIVFYEFQPLLRELTSFLEKFDPKGGEPHALDQPIIERLRSMR